jgi:hypothetical protein
LPNGGHRLLLWQSPWPRTSDTPHTGTHSPGSHKEHFLTAIAQIHELANQALNPVEVQLPGSVGKRAGADLDDDPSGISYY